MDKDFEINIEKSCCFTGHRPEKIRDSEAKVREALRKEILAAIEAGCDTFITGMAPGVDYWAGFEVMDLMASGHNIHLVCAVPFPGVHRKRDQVQKEEFERIIDAADKVEYICPGYRAWCFSARNRWMVDNSSYVIAVSNGNAGGTENTMKYVEKQGRKMVVIDDSKGL